LAVAAERTKNIKFVTGVTAPIFRYNPAIVAQAFASLDVLYPRRISLGIGTGEAMNEVSVGFDWPSPKIRLERTIEALQIIRKLWNKDQNGQEKNSNESQYNSSITSGNDFILFHLMDNILKQRKLNFIHPLLLLETFLCIWLLQVPSRSRLLQFILMA
jgi:alkanesulfonate monooxygenase SsuD/methylene tetrahydromethanopterin reductase-like flavin-dependent oxidoreductase (luciferase family)